MVPVRARATWLRLSIVYMYICVLQLMPPIGVRPRLSDDIVLRTDRRMISAQENTYSTC